MEKIKKNRKEAIDSWAKFVRENPKEWKEVHTEFINAQYKKAWKFIEKLRKEKGREKIVEIYGIKNRIKS